MELVKDEIYVVTHDCVDYYLDSMKKGSEWQYAYEYAQHRHIFKPFPGGSDTKNMVLSDDKVEKYLKLKKIKQMENKYEVSESFIKEAYNAACSDWKLKLEEKFPGVFGKPFPKTMIITHDTCNKGMIVFFTSRNNGTVINRVEGGEYEIGYTSSGWAITNFEDYEVK